MTTELALPRSSIRKRDRDLLRAELLKIGLQLAKRSYTIRGLQAIMNESAIAMVVKQCGRISTIRDVIACGISKDKTPVVLNVI